MDISSLSRFIVLIIAMLNAGLNLAGFQTIPDSLVNDVTLALTGIYTLYMAWKNNYLSRKGQAQKETLDRNGLL